MVVVVVTCRYAKPYWRAVINFIKSVMGVDPGIRIDRLIIFNLDHNNNVVKPEACAFIRHAFGHFYRDFAMVDTHGKAFQWKKTFHDTLLGFRSAVLAWAQTIRIFTANRMYAAQKKKQVPQDTLKMFPTLVEFEDRGLAFTLTQPFTNAIDSARTAAT